MGILRQLMILTLMPLTVWAGISHPACRCSNGEIRLHCPRLNQQTSSATPSHQVASTKSGKCSSCCGKAANNCRQSSKTKPHKPADSPESCCAETCHCTPVLLEGNTAVSLKKASVVILAQLEFLPISVSIVRLPRETRQELVAVDTGPGKPDNLILLFERFLI